MGVKFHLRPVAATDCIALQHTCWPDRSVEAIEELLQRAEGLARRRRGLGIVAVADNYAIAYAQLTLWPRTGEISDLIVATDWRNQGLGSAMIEHLIEKARAWPMPQVEIGVAMSNPRALALYRRLGFKDDHLLNLDLGSGPEAVTYLTMPLQTH